MSEVDTLRHYVVVMLCDIILSWPVFTTAREKRPPVGVIRPVTRAPVVEAVVMADDFSNYYTMQQPVVNLREVVAPPDTDPEAVAEVTSEYRQACLEALQRGRRLPQGKTVAQRLQLRARPPDVRSVADGPPPGNYHDYARPMIRATTGEVCDYQTGDWRTGEVAARPNQPRLLAPNHQMLGVSSI
eukprot:554105-Prorocentrum_minimum.AAC.1